MIRFLKNVREKLIKQKEYSKYIPYAIGEIVLVMLGILLALQVNNWNEERNLKEFEKKLITEIYSALETNIATVERSIRFNEMAKSSSSLILNILENNETDMNSLESHFAKSLFWYKAAADYSAYETAKTYGLHNIANDSIRSLLSEIYEGDFQLITTFEKRNHDYFYHNIIPITTLLFESTHHGILKPPNWEYVGKMTPIKMNSLKNSLEYSHILKTLIENRETDVTFLNRLKNKMVKLKKMINKEYSILNSSEE